MLKIRLPILYSFRRCPYAIRARMAIRSSGIAVEIREIALRNKPEQLKRLSVDGTIPVLQMTNGEVLQESLDIMKWALRENDPINLMRDEFKSHTDKLIVINDHEFKSHLDKYKYSVRYPEHSQSTYRDRCCFFLETLERLLNKNQYLMSERLTLADLAIFPFIRQFASVDKKWFDSAGYNQVLRWYTVLMESSLFSESMDKLPLWDSVNG